MNWVDRYHVVLGAEALLVGVLVAALDRWSPAALRTRYLALAGVVAALLGGWGSARIWPWLLVAGALLLSRDDATSEHQHPLGRWTGPLALAGLVGVWAAVPDTEPPLVAAAVLLPLVSLRSVQRRPIGPTDTAVLVVAVLGAVWVGSAGWGAALAASCAIGATAVAPAVLGFGRHLAGAAFGWLAATHLVVVLLVPRLVMRWSVPAAWGTAVLALILIAAIAGTVTHPRWERSEPPTA